MQANEMPSTPLKIILCKRGGLLKSELSELEATFDWEIRISGQSKAPSEESMWQRLGCINEDIANIKTKMSVSCQQTSERGMYE